MSIKVVRGLVVVAVTLVLSLSGSEARKVFAKAQQPCYSTITGANISNPHLTLVTSMPGMHVYHGTWEIEYFCDAIGTLSACAVCIREELRQSTGNNNGPWGPILTVLPDTTTQPTCGSRHTYPMGTSITVHNSSTWYKLERRAKEVSATTNCSTLTGFTTYKTTVFQTP